MRKAFCSTEEKRLATEKVIRNYAKHGAIFALVLLVFCALLIALFSCNKKDDSTQNLEPTCYDMTIDYDGKNTVFVTEDVLYVNETGCELQNVVFHLYPNAYKSKNGKLDVLSAEIDRQSADYEIYGKDDTLLSLACTLAPDELTSIRLTYKLTLPTADDRLGKTSLDTVNLTGFYPVLSVFENGAWREDGYFDFGDPFFFENASFYITLSFPETLGAAVSGRIEDSFSEDGVTTMEITAENIRDFAAAFGRFNTLNSVAELDGASVDVSYYYVNDANAQASLAAACNAIKTFSATFGNYPYKTFTVVQSPLNAGGMEYGGFVLIAPNQSSESFIETIVHETAHQWWYNVVGSDQLNYAWLDEGLTEFCTSYYFYLNGERDVHKKFIDGCASTYRKFSELPPAVRINGVMSRNLDSFQSESEYVAVTYLKGAMLFESIRELVGDKKFCAGLATYYKDNAYKLASPLSLISAFEKNGCKIGGIINSWTDGSAKI